MDSNFIDRVKAVIWNNQIVAQAAVVSILSYFTALVTVYVGGVKPSNKHIVAIFSAGLILVFIMTLIANLVDKIIRQKKREEDREHSVYRSGYLTLNREISNYIRIVREFENDEPARQWEAPMELMSKAVSELYETLESEYGGSTSIDNHIEFEVTFMTSSMRDGMITIAAWSNRDQRAPKSLTRRLTDSSVYAGTETAKLYEDENMTVRIVESTATADYKELYPGQKGRIRSSIIYPVVDDLFHLVGTLVVHCDRDGFFRHEKTKFWRELLEPYTKRLALARSSANKVKEHRKEYEPF